MRPEPQVSHTHVFQTAEKVTEGKPPEEALDARSLKFAVISARFNGAVTELLLAGALDALKRYGASENNIEIVKVPGAWELPVAAKAIAASKKPDAMIALGAVIRGDTPHFEYVAGQASQGLSALQLETGIPVAFGVLTTNTMEQAMDRAGGKDGNKGYDAALTAIEMANLVRRLRK